MEGLLIAQVLGSLGEAPWTRGSWRFPDPYTFVLPVGELSLWLLVKPPTPLLELRSDRAPNSGRGTPFQQLISARATGELLAVEQLKLDRVIRFSFGASEGFVTGPPVSVVAELAGRNSNLLLLDADDRIIGVQREVSALDNRFRQLKAGVPYRPPPEYDRPDPRLLGAEAVSRLLHGKRTKDLFRIVDGVGPELAAAVASAAELELTAEVSADDLPRLERALNQLLEDPAALRLTLQDRGGVREKRAADERSELLALLGKEQQRQIKLLERRLEDVGRLEQAAERTGMLREQGDLLLAYRPAARPGGAVTVTDFSGEEVTIQLEQGQDAVTSAETFYGRARRLEQRLKNARSLVPGLEQELRQAREQLAALPRLSLTELRKQIPEGSAGRARQHRTVPGIRLEGPHGFEIIVGRNARDNDAVTFGIARSRDVWLHVQGYRGSHVIIRAGNREVPFDTVLFAAQLAAGHSQAADSDNVPVDYTLRKNVWRPKGAAAGAVQFTAQKTVYVTPLRNATQEALPGG